MILPKPFSPQDAYFHRAQKMGFRARSAFKLLEILEKYPRLLSAKGDRVLDLGSAPGSFLQVLLQKNPELLVGIDLQEIAPLPRTTLIQGDVFSPESAARLSLLAPFDLITSDLSPKTSGQKDLDQWHSVELNVRVLELLPLLLRPKGNLLLKIFVGADFDEFFRNFKSCFQETKIIKPLACRERSFETYVLGFGFFLGKRFPQEAAK